jgi:hypothetical protein
MKASTPFKMVENAHKIKIIINLINKRARGFHEHGQLRKG